jgi:hypothetical protein
MVVADAARGVRAPPCHPGGWNMRDLGQHGANAAVARQPISIAEWLLLMAGLISAIVVLVAAFGA